MSTRQEIIVQALRHRHAEVCRSTAELVTNTASDFVLRLKHRSLVVEGHQLTKWIAPQRWYAGKCELLDAIHALALNEPFECTSVEPAEDTSFIDELRASAKDPQRRFELLKSRYRNPLNFAARSEEHVREHLLERLMVVDRSRIERQSLNLLHADEFLLRLNLIAINASLSDDLRYLDALNSFYELLPSAWYPESAQNWLRVSFLILYARALVVNFTPIN